MKTKITIISTVTIVLSFAARSACSFTSFGMTKWDKRGCPSGKLSTAVVNNLPEMVK